MSLNKGPVLGKPESIVVILDDDEAVRFSLRAALRATGFTVLAFATAEVMLQQTDLALPTAFVLDFELPGIDGIMAAQHIRACSPDAFIVLLTGHEIASAPASVDLVLRKPFDPARLVGLLRVRRGL